MKSVYKFIYILIIYICFIYHNANANWQKSDNNLNTQQSVVSQETPNTQQDSLPSGVTKDWLNKITDERGNRILPEEEPETDALQQNIFDGDVIGINYGKSVSSAGDVNGDGFDDIIIGDPNGNGGGGTNSGRAYIYYGGTVINSTADVILTGETVNNYFGSSVSNAGDVNSDGYDDVIVGAYGYNSFTGRAYIYYGGASMNNVSDVIMTGAFTNNEFGKSVSGAGDVNNDGFSDVIVGAYAASVYTGKAYIYYGGSSMNNVSDLIMTGENSNDNFGYSVSGAGDVNGDGYQDVICGAYGFNGTGKAYIYFGGASMNNVADVSMFGGAITDFFGASVSNAGDVNDDGYSDVIIGSYGYNSITGRTYIFYGGASMNGVADVTMTGEATNNLFGFSVSDAGDINGDGFADVYVGAYGYNASKGRAYLYYGGASMNNVVDIYMTGETSSNYFGYSVSGGGDVNGDGFADMIAGAYGYNSNTGRAYVYTNTMTGEDISDLTMTGSSNNAFGTSVSNAGDVNHDGFNDVIVGEPGIYARAYIFYGDEIMNNVADVTLTGESIDTSFGASVSTAGDVNSDGYSDVIIGCNRGGRPKIYFGGSNMNNVPDVVMTNDNGRIVSDAGDVNGDGYSDVMVARPENSNWRGTVNIYYGGTNMDNVPDIILTGEAEYEFLGTSISSAGDVNGDGYNDVIVAASREIWNTMKVYIFYGGVNMNTVPDFLTVYPDLGGLYGAIAVSSAGDVNGDGFSDVIIGKPDFDFYKGRVFLYHGGYTMDTIADLSFAGDFSNDYLGWSLSSAGDVNEDGYSDIIISAHKYNNNFPGKCSIYFGSSNMDSLPDITMNGENNGDNFAVGLSSGDFNGDGYSDVIVGAPDFDQSRGKAYIYLSSPPDNRKNLFLFGAIQGLYDPVSDTEVPDTIKVYLRNSTSPFARVDSSKNILLGPGTGQQFLFRNAQNGIPYYIEVSHRNALATWSAAPVTFVNSDASIAFSVDDTYAYGNNEILVDASPYNVFAFYSGDVNQDGFIDLTDVLTIYNGANNFLTGYVVTDLTGDSIVDLTDLLMAYNNSVKFVSVMKP